MASPAVGREGEVSLGYRSPQGTPPHPATGPHRRVQGSDSRVVQRGREGDQELGFMSIIPISLGLGWIRGQVGDHQLQANDRLPAQGKQGCCPICIPGGQIPLTL